MMNVDDAGIPFSAEVPADYLHVAGKDNKIDLVFFENFLEVFFVCLFTFRCIDLEKRDVERRRNVGEIGMVRDNHRDFTIEFSVGMLQEDFVEAVAGFGYKYGDFLFSLVIEKMPVHPVLSGYLVEGHGEFFFGKYIGFGE